MTGAGLEIVHEDGESEPIAADHFAFERSTLTLTRWELVLGRPREVVVRRLPRFGRRPVLGVLGRSDGPCELQLDFAPDFG